MIKTTDIMVVELDEVAAPKAYAMGFEAGAFVQYLDENFLDRHVIFAANAVIIEMIAMERGFELLVIHEIGDRLVVEISRR